MKFDLHTHSNYSDGDLSVEENVKKALEMGFSGIAITDHDNIDSWRDIDNGDFDITVIKGVELSTYHKNEVVHILGYYLNDGGDYSELDNTLKKIREDRYKRLEKIIELLKPLGITLTVEDVLKEADGAVGRPHIASAILKKYPERGYTKNEIFDRFIGNDAPAYVPVNDFQTKDAIKLLKDNHCLVVLAHPLLIKKFKYQELIDYGIDGIEGYYCYRDGVHPEVIAYGDDLGLIVTGGSDYHGPITRDSMGKAYLEGERVNTFLEAINYSKKIK